MIRHLKSHKTGGFNGGRPSGIRTLTNQSGVALVTALLFMVVLIALVPAAISLTSGEFDRADDFKDGREAFFLAEAGLEHAKYLTEQRSSTIVLAGPDGDPASTTDNGTFSIGTPSINPLNDGFNYNVATIGTNTYYIRAYDNDDGDSDLTQDRDFMIILSSVGIVDDVTKKVQALVYYPTFPTNALTTNGDLTISGNPPIKGTCGNVHANDDLILNSPLSDIDGTNTGSDDLVVSGIPQGGTGNDIPVPFLDPTDYQEHADYTLTADGKVFEKGNPTAIHDRAFDGDSWTTGGWKWTSASPPYPPKWIHEGDTLYHGTFYVDGDAQVPDSPGLADPSNPWQASIYATGHIDVNGNPVVVNKKNPGDPLAVQDLFLVAGTDVSFSGNPSQTVDGLFYATQQLKISGAPLINGAVMAYDSPTTAGSGDLVLANEISGDPTITYGCGLTVPNTAGIKVISWNEL